MVHIITDSSTLITQDEAKELGIDVLPLCVNIGELEGRDLQMDMRDFTSGLKTGAFQDHPSHRLAR